MQSHRYLNILKTTAYLLAGLVLLIGLITGLSLIASAGNIHNLLLPLQLMGAEAIVNLISPFLTNLIGGLGVLILIICLVLSLLLFVAGRLLGHVASLEVRLAQLEAQI